MRYPGPGLPANNTNCSRRSRPQQWSDDLRIVVVEDHEATRYGYCRILQHRGYSVSSASSADEGLTAIAASNPHCVLLDLGLPDLDGFDLALLLKARYGSGLVIIAITGIQKTGVHYADERAGVDFLLREPLNIDKLLSILPARGH